MTKKIVFRVEGSVEGTVSSSDCRNRYSLWYVSNFYGYYDLISNGGLYKWAGVDIETKTTVKKVKVGGNKPKKITTDQSFVIELGGPFEEIGGKDETIGGGNQKVGSANK